jgi:unsaturated rhamnogalacturonyl hydrolase
MWHTVLDDHETYAESSATMMFTYAVLKLARLGVLPKAGNVEMVMKAWDAVNKKCIENGVVKCVSAGTGPGNNQAYRKIAIGSETWGTGAYLMAGSEVHRRK